MGPSLQLGQPESDVVMPDLFIARVQARLGASEGQTSENVPSVERHCQDLVFLGCVSDYWIAYVHSLVALVARPLPP